MKPNRIFLVRHGESEGNVNKAIYSEKPDYALNLTETGRRQAHDVGIELSKIINGDTVKFYVSPFWRTRQTYLEIVKQFDPQQMPSKVYEDPRLREQEWGQNLEDRSGYKDKIEEYRDNYGHFYYRFTDGESCADVFDRIGDFMNTLHRDFEENDFPNNVIIVMHGMSMRLFLMRWFHNTVEEFESWSNPKNCGIVELVRGVDNKYTLITPLKTHVVKHSYQFPEYTTLKTYE